MATPKCRQAGSGLLSSRWRLIPVGPVGSIGRGGARSGRSWRGENRRPARARLGLVVAKNPIMGLDAAGFIARKGGPHLACDFRREQPRREIRFALFYPMAPKMLRPTIEKQQNGSHEIAGALRRFAAVLETCASEYSTFRTIQARRTRRPAGLKPDAPGRRLRRLYPKRCEVLSGPLLGRAWSGPASEPQAQQERADAEEVMGGDVGRGGGELRRLGPEEVAGLEGEG